MISWSFGSCLFTPFFFSFRLRPSLCRDSFFSFLRTLSISRFHVSSSRFWPGAVSRQSHPYTYKPTRHISTIPYTPTSSSSSSCHFLSFVYVLRWLSVYNSFFALSHSTVRRLFVWFLHKFRCIILHPNAG